jgi:hypothetical protein
MRTHQGRDCLSGRISEYTLFPAAPDPAFDIAPQGREILIELLAPTTSAWAHPFLRLSDPSTA